MPALCVWEVPDRIETVAARVGQDIAPDRRKLGCQHAYVVVLPLLTVLCAVPEVGLEERVALQHSAIRKRRIVQWYTYAPPQRGRTSDALSP